MYRIDPFGLLQRVFGFGRERLIRHYRVGEAAVLSSGSSSYDLEEIPVLESDVKSYFGTPVLTPVTVEAGRYPERGENGGVNFVDYPEYQFPHTTMVEVNQPKLIRKTEISGRSGTVKEYISDGDFEIRLRGLIVNQADDYPPELGIRAMRQILRVPAPLVVQSEFFEWLGVGDIVVEDSGIFQLEGFSHVVAFDIRAVSDFTPEVRLRDGL